MQRRLCLLSVSSQCDQFLAKRPVRLDILSYFVLYSVMSWLCGVTSLWRVDCKPSRLEVRCVRPSVRPQKFFSDFDLICCMGRPRPRLCTSVTSTQSKVKVKVMELLKLRKVHFSRSISSTTFTCSSKLMVDGDSIGRGLRLFWARFLNLLLGKLSQEFRLRRISIFHDIKQPYFRTVWCYSQMVGRAGSSKVLCMLMWPWPSPRSRSRGFWTSEN